MPVREPGTVLDVRYRVINKTLALVVVVLGVRGMPC